VTGARVLRTVRPAAAAAAVLFGFTLLLQSDVAMGTIQRAFAVVAGAVLRVLGQQTMVHGTEILSARFGISVVAACTGLFLTGLFVAAVVAFPTSWRRRAAGAAVGIAGLFLLNVIRLVTLFVVGAHWPSALAPLHQLVWQSLAIALAVALWLTWAARVSRHETGRKVGT
jgi:exosortase/archaeosortase family protein